MLISTAASECASAPAGTPGRPGVRADRERSGGLRGPDWVKDAIFYQVFPDRFRDGDPSNNPPGSEPWGSQPKNDGVFQGGDLQGVQQGLGHLRKLGVNALYLNPIMTSPSNHRYNVTDYDNVDPALGGNQAFERLVDDLHAGGMKLILDGVFNHTSNEHSWFQDIAKNGSKSPYWNWYNVYRHPIATWKDQNGVLRTNDYEGWGKVEWGGPYASLPVLRSQNPELMERLFTGRDSVLRKWMRDGRIDGWRMDAADDIEPEIWRTVREVAKRDKPDAYLLGENWQDASGMLEGDQFDGAMNYKYFQQPAVEFFAKKQISTDDFVARLRNGYSKEARLGMMNILESHDTPRFITQAGGDWYRARPAAIFQLTYQGAPSIYYGAELGMEGGQDPDSRRAFDWNLAATADAKTGAAALRTRGNVSPEARAAHLTTLYQRLTETRTKSDALRRGDFDVLATHNDHKTLAFRRWVDGSDEDVVVAINNDTVGHGVTIPTSFAPDGTTYRDALTEQTFTVQGGKLTLPHVDGNFGAVLVRT